MVRDWTDKVAREDTFDMWSAKSSTKVPSLSAILILNSTKAAHC